MHEHSMLTSDYAIKVVGLMEGNEMDLTSRERLWQLEELKRIINDNKQNSHTN